MKDKTGEKLRNKLMETLKNASKKAKKSPYLKERVDIICDCGGRKRNEKDRVKFGTCRCDSYSLSWTLALVISNSLYQYLADAKSLIVREDWEEIEKHAKAIKKYATADSWDLMSKVKGEKKAYIQKDKEFKKALKWLGNNWQSLWW